MRQGRQPRQAPPRQPKPPRYRIRIEPTREGDGEPVELGVGRWDLELKRDYIDATAFGEANRQYLVGKQEIIIRADPAEALPEGIAIRTTG